VTTTVITGSWKDPQEKTYKNFLVAALVKNLPARSSVEGEISRNLTLERVSAAKSYDVLGHSEKLETADEKRAAVEKIRSLGYDAIIAITLLRQEEESRYVEGTSSYTPASVGVGTGYYDPLNIASAGAGNYGAFGIYYMDAATPYNSPGYYVKDKIYFVQCNLYDLQTGKLVWSAQSETFQSENLAATSRDFGIAMVRALKEANLIYRK